MRNAKYSRRTLLVISDGGDNHSRYTENDVRDFLREADCQLYAIGLFDGTFLTAEELYGPVLLGSLAKMSGGQAFSISTIDDLSDVAVKIGNTLRNQYVLGYRSSNPQRDGRWRKITVKLNVPKGAGALKVHTRSGYYAPGVYSKHDSRN
jgi:Ca-activated chloride channel family protein